MRTRATRLLIGLAGTGLALHGAVAQANGLIDSLPQDGTWALFRTSGYEDKSHRGGPKEEFEGWLRISSVGKVDEAGEPCRWIEVNNSWKGKGEDDSQTRTTLLKVLVPEDKLVRGQSPADHVIRGWRKRQGIGGPGQGQVLALKEQDGKTQLRDEERWLLMGPVPDAKQLEPVVVESTLGKLKCEGLRGTLPVTDMRPRMDGVPPTFEARLHEKAPFGVVRYEFTGKEPSGDEFQISLVLDDHGKTALTELPQHK